MRLAIFLSHPIQHFIPWLRELNRALDGELMVHYASKHGLEERFDPEFMESFAWDMDLLSGYKHTFWELDASVGPGDGFRAVRYRGIARALRAERPDAVLIWGWLFQGYWEVAWHAKRAGIPYIVRGESNLGNRGSASRWWLKKQTVGRLCRNAGACLSIGKRNEELYLAYGVHSKRLLCAPYFVDNDWFRAEAQRLRPSRADLRRKWKLPVEAFVVLFMGKLVRKKHPDHLLTAWQGLEAEHRDRSALLFVGSGEMASELSSQVRGCDAVVFAGLMNRPQLPEAYAVSDVLVLPSDSGETWGLVVNEAMASGLPAIVSDQVGSAPDLVSEGQTGLTFRFSDIDALRSSLRSVIANPALAKMMGRNAARHVDLASLDRAVSQTRRALELVCSRRSEEL